jgi:hypothetical protein
MGEHTASPIVMGEDAIRVLTHHDPDPMVATTNNQANTQAAATQADKQRFVVYLFIMNR